MTCPNLHNAPAIINQLLSLNNSMMSLASWSCLWNVPKNCFVEIHFNGKSFTGSFPKSTAFAFFPCNYTRMVSRVMNLNNMQLLMIFVNKGNKHNKTVIGNSLLLSRTNIKHNYQ